MRKPILTFRLHAIASVIAAMGSGAAQSATVNWIGATSTWNTASNWSSSPALPGTADDVVINVAGLQTVTHSTGTDTVRSISITGDDILAITGGTLNAGFLSNTGTINVASGTFGITSGTSGTMNLTGGVTALTGTLSLTGVVTVGGGTIQGGTVQENAANALRFTGSNSNTLDGVTVRGVLSVGDATNTSGRVRISNGLTVLTEAGGSPGVINVGTVAGATSAVIGFTGTQSFNNATINLGNTPQAGNLSLA